MYVEVAVLLKLLTRVCIKEFFFFQIVEFCDEDVYWFAILLKECSSNVCSNAGHAYSWRAIQLLAFVCISQQRGTRLPAKESLATTAQLS